MTTEQTTAATRQPGHGAEPLIARSRYGLGFSPSSVSAPSWLSHGTRATIPMRGSAIRR